MECWGVGGVVKSMDVESRCKDLQRASMKTDTDEQSGQADEKQYPKDGEEDAIEEDAIEEERRRRRRGEEEKQDRRGEKDERRRKRR